MAIEPILRLFTASCGPNNARQAPHRLSMSLCGSKQVQPHRFIIVLSNAVAFVIHAAQTELCAIKALRCSQPIERNGLGDVLCVSLAGLAQPVKRLAPVCQLIDMDDDNVAALRTSHTRRVPRQGCRNTSINCEHVMRKDDLRCGARKFCHNTGCASECWRWFYRCARQGAAEKQKEFFACDSRLLERQLLEHPPSRRTMTTVTQAASSCNPPVAAITAQV